MNLANIFPWIVLAIGVVMLVVGLVKNFRRRQYHGVHHVDDTQTVVMSMKAPPGGTDPTQVLPTVE